MDTALLGFGSAIGGAVVGGVLAMAGGIVVSRREAKRTAQVRLFDEVLPPLMFELELGHDALAYKPDLLTMRAVVRYGILAGRKTRRCTTALDLAWLERKRVLDGLSRPKDWQNDTTLTAEAQERVDAATAVLRQRVEELYGHLERDLA